MRICVDIQAAVGQRTGVGQYTRALVQHLGRYSGADSLRLFYFDCQRRGRPFPADRAEFRAVRWCPGRLAQYAWKQWHMPPFDWLAGAADVYHFPNFVVPPLRRGKAVVSIHDMSFLRHPEFAEARNQRYLASVIGHSARRADAIITLSRFSAREIQELLGVPADRIFPIPLGAALESPTPDAAAVQAMRARLGLDRPYLLTVSTLEPRKNIPLLVDVFERTAFDGDLVIAGMRGWKYEPILARIAASPRRDRIRLPGYVPPADLPALYAGAQAFVFPSFYEGFGMPPLEAMLNGVPVVASTGGSLPEVLGDAAVLVEPNDCDAWVARLDAVLHDANLRRRLVAGGRLHAARFTWDETARQTWAVYQKVAG